MKQQYYEVHVTMMGHPDFIRPHVEAINWIFSAIDGDPNLGDGVKCYATRQYNARNFTEKDLINHVEEAAKYFESQECKVLRKKIELVVYDERL